MRGALWHRCLRKGNVEASVRRGGGRPFRELLTGVPAHGVADTRKRFGLAACRASKTVVPARPS
jgi:hypothetical protein